MKHTFRPGWLRQAILDAVASFTKQPYVPPSVRQELKAAAREIRKSKLLRSQQMESGE